MKSYVADFETTVEKDKTRVWAWGHSEIGNVEKFEYGTTIGSFFTWLKKSNKIVYFHNLAFDGEFLIYHLLANLGFTYSEKKESNTFNCLISKDGAFYKIEIIFEKKNKKYKKVEILDSRKKLPFSVDAIGKGFGLPYQKMEVDKDFYTRYRPEGHVLTDLEVDYLRLDCQTVASALGIQFEQDLVKMTIGGDSMYTYKKMLGSGDKKRGDKQFLRLFPKLPLHMDLQIRQSYKGGYVYVKKAKAGKSIKKGKVYDINSLYPWVLRDCLLPYGMPIYYTGKYEKNSSYPLYIQRLRCSFRLKDEHLPMIQIKGGKRFVQTEYLTTSEDKLGNDEVTLVLTNVDLELFLEHYDVDVIEWEGGFMFKGAVGLFNEYIDHFMKMKIDNDDNLALRSLAKLLLNNLYGKFCKNPNVDKKIPYLHEKGHVAYELEMRDPDEPVYTAVGSFVTAYARDKTIRAGQKNYDRFLYADTDSLHLEGWEEPKDLHVHKTELGAWKHEGDFVRGRFLRPKTYVEELPNKKGVLEMHVTCAGMPDNLKAMCTWDNFHVGLELHGKLRPTHVPGGIVLQPTSFKIA